MTKTSLMVGDTVSIREDLTDEEFCELQATIGELSDGTRVALLGLCKVIEIEGDSVKIAVEAKELVVNIGLLKIIGKVAFRTNETGTIISEEKQMKELQVDHGGWHDIMRVLLDKEVTVVRVVTETIRRVKYLGMEFNVNVACLVKKKEFVVGRKVRLLESETEVRRLQVNHGGWVDRMQHFLGHEGLVIDKTLIGDIAVSFGVQIFVFNPDCLELEDGKAQMFLEAIYNKNRENIIALVNPTIIDKPCSSTGLTPLMIALETNQEDIFDLLIEKGANINGKDKKGNNLLHFVITKKMEDATVDKLIKGGVEINGQNNDGKSVLMTCVENDNSTVFSKLMDDDLIDVSLQDMDGDTAVHYAIREGRVEMIKRLIEGGCCMKTENNDKFSPFHLSVLKNQYEIVELMLEKEGSALVNLQKSNDQYSGLHLTALHGYCDVMKLLIRHGADTTLRNNDGETALHIAVLKDVDCVKLLCREMEDINVEDHRGNSPLHRLVHRIPEKELENGLKIAQCLIEFHVDMNMVNKRGMTAIGICENKEMKEMLIDSMGTKDSEKENKIEEQPLQDVSDLKVLEEQIIKFEDERLCKICIDRPKDTIFDCGHICCGPCSSRLTSCPVCREMISSRIKLFSTVL